MVAPHISVLKRVFSVTFVALVFALVGFAIYVFRLRCEGFGCTGIGIAWAAWTAAFVPALAMGAVLRYFLPEATRDRAVVSSGLVALIALGAALVLYWLVHLAA